MNGRTNTSGITVNNGISIPLEAPTNLLLSAGDQTVSMTWTDPIDKYTETFNELVSQWSYDTVVRKEGSAPSSPQDGTVVAKITSKNQHQNVPYTDTGMENDKRWYYSVYSWNQFGTQSEPASDSGIPTGTIINQYKTVLSSRVSNIPMSDEYSKAFVFGSTRNHLIVIDPDVNWFAYNSNLVKSNISNTGGAYTDETSSASSTTIGYYATFFRNAVGDNYPWKSIDDNLVVSEHTLKTQMNQFCLANVNNEIGIIARNRSGFMFNENLVLQSITTTRANVPLSSSSYAGFDGDHFYDVDGVAHSASPDLDTVASSTNDEHYMIFYGQQKAAAIDDRTLVAQSIDGIWNISDNDQENEASALNVGMDCQTIGCGLIFKFGSGMGSIFYGGTDIIDRNLVLSDGSSVFPFTESNIALSRGEALDFESSVLRTHRFANYVAIPLAMRKWDDIYYFYEKRMAVYIIENGYESDLEEV